MLVRERLIHYSDYADYGWLYYKALGLTNRFHKSKRAVKWYLYRNLQPPQLDYNKILPNSMPVLITNYNRYSLLRKQIDWLLSLNDPVSIIIVDNNSKYEPLLDFYDQLNYENVQVIHLKINSWYSGVEYIAKKIGERFTKYVATDSDLLPYESTPNDLISYLSELLDEYTEYNHVGLSLEISDIPDHNPLKNAIIQHESQFWDKSKFLSENVIVASIDMTFAMYRNTSKLQIRVPALRTARPYTLKHEDWYYDPENFSDEYLFYLNTCEPMATWATEFKLAQNIKKGSTHLGYSNR